MRATPSIALLLLCAPLLAVSAVDEASSHNAALAHSLLGAANACNSSSRAPTEGDIFSVAYARIVSIMPSVGNTTSDLSNASVLWSYFASNPPEAVFSGQPDLRCPASETRYFAPSAPSLSGSISYRYGNSTEELPVSSAGPNPAPLNLSGSKLTIGDLLQPFAPLQISISANISATYSFSKSSYAYGCSGMGEYTVCGCEHSQSFGSRAFTQSVYHARNFSVETGPVSVLWLNPPLQSRLSGNANGKIALFARRRPAGISLFFRGNQVASVQPYSFSVSTGSCGEQIAELEFSPSSLHASISAGEPAFPYQLVEENASYLPFQVEFPWRAEPGRGNFTVEAEDAFSHRQAFSREFFVREPLPFSAQAGPPGSSGGNGAMGKREAGDSETAAEYPAQEMPADFPGLSSIAASFALLLAMGAAGLFRFFGRRQ